MVTRLAISPPALWLHILTGSKALVAAAVLAKRSWPMGVTFAEFGPLCGGAGLGVVPNAVAKLAALDLQQLSASALRLPAQEDSEGPARG